MILRCSGTEATLRLEVVSSNLGFVSYDLCKQVCSWWPYRDVFWLIFKILGNDL